MPETPGGESRRCDIWVGERIHNADEFDDPRLMQSQVPNVEAALRSGWQPTALYSRGEGSSSLESDEPIVATTWIEGEVQQTEEVHQRYLNVIDLESRDIVTVIEILSPTNKIPGSQGRESYRQKFLEVMHSSSHLVEIDLLRGPEPYPSPGKSAPTSIWSIYPEKA